MSEVYELAYSKVFSAEKPLLILDRDSTIIEDFGYTWKREDLHFVPGALDSIRFAAENNFSVALATNQSGLGRGYFSLDDYREFSNLLVDKVINSGGRIDFIATCPHLPSDACECRKPKPGLVNAVLDKFKVPKRQTLLVGNDETDVQAGKSAGVVSFLTTGIGIKEQISEWLKQIDNH